MKPFLGIKPAVSDLILNTESLLILILFNTCTLRRVSCQLFQSINSWINITKNVRAKFLWDIDVRIKSQIHFQNSRERFLLDPNRINYCSIYHVPGSVFSFMFLLICRHIGKALSGLRENSKWCWPWFSFLLVFQSI